MTTTIPDQAHDLAIANRILVARGVLDAYGHVSVRADGDPEHFLLARNVAPASATASDVQVFDLDGETDDPRPSYLERFIHSEVYRRRPDVRAIVHSHSAGILPFTVVDRPLVAISHMAGFLRAGVPRFEIRDVLGDASNLLVGSPQLGSALATVLADRDVVLMRGHGSVVVGGSLPEAVHRAVFAEANARALLQAVQLGGSITPLSSDEAEAVVEANSGQTARAWNVWAAEVAAGLSR